MNSIQQMQRALLALASAAVIAALTSMPAQAQKATSPNQITIIQLADTHGNLVPHAAEFQNPDGTERFSAAAGGLAKLKKLVDQIREENPNNLLLAVGDTTHGGAEALFTVGDAMMPALNAFGIDAFTPGNWDFGYGPAVFRNRFSDACRAGVPVPPPLCPPLPANIRVMSGAMGCADLPDPAGCVERGAPGRAGVIQANFPTLMANVYNDFSDSNLPFPPTLKDAQHGKRLTAPYKVFDVGQHKIGVIGITAAILPQQANVFNIGLAFTQGVEELPGLIEDVKAEGANIIVVQSELGLSQNIEIGRRFKEVDVILSAHTHEVTIGALLADQDEVTRVDPRLPLNGAERSRLVRGATIVVETGEDTYLGRLDLQLTGGGLVDFRWQAVPVDEDVPEDVPMAALVHAAERFFVDGPDFVEHTFMPGGFCTPPAPADCGDVTTRGLRLVEPLDTVVGHTDVLLARHDVLEDVVNNWIADALNKELGPPAQTANPDWATLDVISMTNGFRFGTPILGPLEGAGLDFPDRPKAGDITLRDLYTLFPISPAAAVAEFSGLVIDQDLEVVLSAVFNRNPFLQRGGWYLSFSSNMTQTLDLKNRPLSSSGGRIIETRIGDAPLDPSKRYVFASCFPHGDPLDRICRTFGGVGHLFYELGDANNYASAIALVNPISTEAIIQGPVIKQVAPDRFLHPVHVLRRHLDSLPGKLVTNAQFGVGRVATVDSTKLVDGMPEPVADPESQYNVLNDNTPDTSLIQPPFGAGPRFFSGRVGDGE